jgi:hypothetical protein
MFTSGRSVLEQRVVRTPYCHLRPQIDIDSSPMRTRTTHPGGTIQVEPGPTL